MLAGCAQGRSVGDEPDAPAGDDGVDAPGQIDAPGHIDAAPDARPDARPDAPGCTVQNQQKLTNPSLDQSPTGTGWYQVPIDMAYPLITDQVPGGLTPISAPNIDWQGGIIAPFGQMVSDRLYQDVAIPASATAAELRVWRWIATEETSGQYDFMWVEIRSTADTVLEPLAQWSNADDSSGWINIMIPLGSAHAGQTIRVNFRTRADDSLNTNFFLDTIRLMVTVCN